LTAVLNAMPIERATAFSMALGDFLFLFATQKKKTAMENIDRVFGATMSRNEREELARHAFRNFATSLMEFFRMEPMLAEAKDRFEFEGTEHLDRAFAKNKGVIGVISHLGSWEYLAFLPYLRGYPCSVVVRDIKNPYLDKWIRDLRQATKLNPINRHRSIREILSELRKNHYVAILIDQWAGPDGLWLDFFNKPTSTTSVPARLAQKTGAALVPMHCLRTAPGKYKITIYPEIPLSAVKDWEADTTLVLNQILEKEILKAPEQWIWSHRRWKDITRYRSNPSELPV
jgi:Kdo2-lipid IVA lauroyltransferase/acyltransferase